MKEEINPALWQELKRLGRELSPDELRQRGVKRVISIRTSEISRGIERAINRTILERTIGRADADELRVFTAAASAEFASRLRDGDERRPQHGTAHEELAPSYADDLPGFGELLEHHRGELRAELESVHAELEGRLNERRGFAEQQEAPSAWPLDPERADDLRLRVQARLLPVFERLPSGSPPLRSVVADLLNLFVEDRGSALAELRRQADAELAVLERRLAKLIVSLEETERLLERLGQQTRGRASGHRAARDEANASTDHEDADELARRRAAQQKREMLQGIYRANVELQFSPELSGARANGATNGPAHE